MYGKEDGVVPATFQIIYFVSRLPSSRAKCVDRMEACTKSAEAAREGIGTDEPEGRAEFIKMSSLYYNCLHDARLAVNYARFAGWTVEVSAWDYIWGSWIPRTETSAIGRPKLIHHRTRVYSPLFPYSFTSSSLSTSRIPCLFSARRCAFLSRIALFLTRLASICSWMFLVRTFSALARWMCSVRTRLFLNRFPLDSR